MIATHVITGNQVNGKVIAKRKRSTSEGILLENILLQMIMALLRVFRRKEEEEEVDTQV